MLDFIAKVASEFVGMAVAGLKSVPAV